MRDISAREKQWLAVSHPGTEPTAQAWAPTSGRTRDRSVCGTMPNRLSHTGQGVLMAISITPRLTCLNLGPSDHPGKYIFPSPLPP